MNNDYKHFIEGKRLYLREVCLNDVNDNYCRWLNDPEVTQYLEVRFIPQSIECIKEYVERMRGNRDEILLAICLKRDGRHIGNIKLGPINWIHRFADISLFIGEKREWHKGYATEAIRLISSYAFQRLNLRKLTAGCYAENIGSLRAFEKAGFLQEAALRSHYFSKGKYTDRISLALFRFKEPVLGKE